MASWAKRVGEALTVADGVQPIYNDFIVKSLEIALGKDLKLPKKWEGQGKTVADILSYLRISENLQIFEEMLVDTTLTIPQKHKIIDIFSENQLLLKGSMQNDALVAISKQQGYAGNIEFSDVGHNFEEKGKDFLNKLLAAVHDNRQFGGTDYGDKPKKVTDLLTTTSRSIESVANTIAKGNDISH